jgi:hypothetical protein
VRLRTIGLTSGLRSALAGAFGIHLRCSDSAAAYELAGFRAVHGQHYSDPCERTQCHYNLRNGTTVRPYRFGEMCNLYSITANQATIIALFRVMNRYVGNLPPMPGVVPDHPAPVIRNTGGEQELVLMRWGMPPPPRTGGPPVTNISNTSSPHCAAG